MVEFGCLFGQITEVFFLGFDLILKGLCEVGGSFGEFAAEGVFGGGEEGELFEGSFESGGKTAGYDSGYHLN